MGRPRKEDAEQQPLIDVEPENMKVILRKARAYVKAKDECHESNEDAKKKLNALRDAIKEAKLVPLEGNVYRIQCGNHIIEMIPQSEKVKIKAVGNGEDSNDEGDGDE